jgi:hypothetical protein
MTGYQEEGSVIRRYLLARGGSANYLVDIFSLPALSEKRLNGGCVEAA